jgi:hypothetical protein
VILRVPDNFREKPLQIDGAKIFEPVPDRPMLECVTVAPEAIKNREKLALCVSRAFEFGFCGKPKLSQTKSN